MKQLILIIAALWLLSFPVSAATYEPPDAPPSVKDILPPETRSFGEDFWYIIKSALFTIKPDIAEAVSVCISVISIVILTSILQTFTGKSKKIAELACTMSIALILLGPSNVLIQLGVNTVRELSEYSKLLMPVLTAALAAEGGITASAALYTGTILFNTILGTGISIILTPMLYIYILLCIANSAFGNSVLKGMCDFVKWLMTWSLKIILYIFTGYMGITGVVSGTTDAAALKATKLALSGMVPVVGGIMSDASESILVSAGIMKNSVGVYGLLVILALWIGPFLELGIHYTLLKVTSGICGMIGPKESVGLIKNFSSSTGMLLSMTASVCLMLLISAICFMKGFT